MLGYGAVGKSLGTSQTAGCRWSSPNGVLWSHGVIVNPPELDGYAGFIKAVCWS
jgi:hypothetical protein